jgi:hypothetical protein
VVLHSGIIALKDKQSKYAPSDWDRQNKKARTGFTGFYGGLLTVKNGWF